MPELTPEYINSITQEELRAAGYTVEKEDEDDDGWFVLRHHGEMIYEFSYYVDAWCMARRDYAPRKLLAEAQARIAALEMLVRCADELLAGSEPVLARIYDGGDTRDWVYKDDWRDEAAKLLEVGDV